MKTVPHPDLPIVLVDDDEGVARAVARTLAANGYSNVVAVSDSRRVLSLLRESGASLMLLDITMPHLRGDELLLEIAANFPELPVIMATATDSIDTVVDCMKKGAFDYVTKPLSTGRLLASISGALAVRELRRENAALRGGKQDGPPFHPELFHDFLAASPEMLAVFRYIEQIGPSGQPVLISGETGVGKELAALAVHRASGRSGQFVAVNVAGLDDEVFSDTLFGHGKGAFTSAVSAREGQIKRAVSGTLFLDEIGDLTLKSQVKLLRLLQEKEYLPLGSDTPRKTDARVVAATNCNLLEMLAGGTFRKDLYFRLNAHHVHLPPLRKRLDDLRLLVPYFAGQAAREFGKKNITVPRELYGLLDHYSFPGNVRELKALIFDGVGRQQGNVLGLESFARGMGLSAGKTSPLPAKTDGKVRFGDMLPSMKDMRRLLAEEALKRADGNVSMAARLIGLSRQSLSQFLHNNDICLPPLRENGK
ncbi:MAG: sigma-54-dependent Fis family transcriptional regulator [Deltaproteobacteria bacterium]|nr:sigma-54-dependent Fis family transcriptional regulator [Deltaproteobacteria bacterium]